MHTYFALFLIATFASLTLTPIVRRLCERFNLLDVPTDGRRLHSSAVPRLGGVAIYLSCLIALGTLPFVDNLLTHTLRGRLTEISVALVPATLVFLLGIYDDLRGANAPVKLTTLSLIAVLFFVLGGRIEVLSIPFLGPVHLPLIVSLVLTVVWLVGIANAFNLIDGMDGLASGAALFSSLVILAISFAQGQPMMIVVALVLCGALAGFLRYNINPASIFLGDSGALFVGFTLASLSVMGSQKASTTVAVAIPILAFGLPVVDTVVTIMRRLVSGQPIFQGDKEHIHHMLIARGWSQNRVMLILYATCAAFSLAAILFSGTSSNYIGFGLFVLGVVTLIGLGRLRYHEVDELRAGMRRTVGDRRARVAKNIRIRRATVAVSNAGHLNEVLAAISEMLEFEEFDYAHLELGQAGRSEVNRRAFDSISPRQQLQRVQFDEGKIVWSWRLPHVDEEKVTASTDYWRFRLPLANAQGEWGWMTLYRPLDRPPMLVDMNYLSGFLRVDLTEAVSRILTTFAESAQDVSTPLSMTAGRVVG
jgi:UDP-GlcNAc:undecaprenyl-phosphate/decaprenyl-phosphate GlcNAc-1-phosphate transferase